MQFSILAPVFLALSAITAVTAQNPSSFGPLGTSPTQRFELNQTQALQIIAAASTKAANLT